MKKIKKALRLIGLTLLIILAMCGVGFLGALFPNYRNEQTKPMNVERKDEDREDDDSSEIKT